MVDREKLITIASLEIGYLEKKSNAQLDDKTANAGSKNYTKFARDYDSWYGGTYKYQGQAWCDIFVDWCFVQAFGIENAKKLLGGFSAYTPTSAQYFKNQGRYYKTNPQKYDVIFFRNSERICHTGIVIKVENGYVYTIEGNTSGASGLVANGGGVVAKSYKIANNTYIDGYGRPDYESIEDDSISVVWNTTGTATCTGNSVRIRKTPNGTILRSLNKGDQMEVDSTTDGDWLHVKYENIIGWMHKNYVQINNKKSAQEVAMEIYKGIGNWGNGDIRKKNVTDYGLDYELVRAYVNELSKNNGKFITNSQTNTNNSSNNIPSTPTVETKPTTSNTVKYTTGTYKVVCSALTVRTGPGTNYPQVPYSKLTDNAKKHANSNGCLKNGTYMTVSEVIKNSGNDYWAKIPSGYVCIQGKDGTVYCSK